MTDPPLDVEGDLLGRPAPFVTFYSFKGGVGRSMALINVAGIVASRGFRVLVIDMDLEAPGLSFLTRRSGGETATPIPGFVDSLVDARQRGEEADLFRLPPRDFVERYCAPFELPEGFRAERSALFIMPAGRLDGGYSQRFDELDLAELYRAGVGLSLVQAFKQAVQDAKLFDYVFVDSRTGFSDESGICTRDLADGLFVLSGLNIQNVQGTARFLSALRAASDEPPPVAVVLSPIPNGEDALVDERVERAEKVFAEAWGEPVKTDLQIPYHPQLALTEYPHIFRRQRGYLFEAYHRIERRLLSLLGDTWGAWSEKAARAIREDDAIVAEDALRRAGMLADGPGWADRVVRAFGPAREKLLGAPGGERLVERVRVGASPAGRFNLSEVLRRVALDCALQNWGVADLCYRQAIESEPRDATTLALYAHFLMPFVSAVGRIATLLEDATRLSSRSPIVQLVRGEVLWRHEGRLDEAGERYRKAMDLMPDSASSWDAWVRCNAAGFWWHSQRDIETALRILEPLSVGGTQGGAHLDGRAVILYGAGHDAVEVEELHKEAIACSRPPHSASHRANYSRFLIAEGRMPEGVQHARQALDTLGPGSRQPVVAECCMYLYCCAEAAARAPALDRLRILVEHCGLRTWEWDFSLVIDRVRDTHPESRWLDPLAEVLAARAEPSILADWPAWQAAASVPEDHETPAEPLRP